MAQGSGVHAGVAATVHTLRATPGRRCPPHLPAHVLVPPRGPRRIAPLLPPHHPVPTRIRLQHLHLQDNLGGTAAAAKKGQNELARPDTASSHSGQLTLHSHRVAPQGVGALPTPSTSHGLLPSRHTNNRYSRHLLWSGGKDQFTPELEKPTGQPCRCLPDPPGHSPDTAHQPGPRVLRPHWTSVSFLLPSSSSHENLSKFVSETSSNKGQFLR